jgi:glycosyltransferase involved in cell wall biosynthesis
MNTPLVSVICLCYNHARFVGEAIASVLNQTHTNVQLIVVDDASSDGSVETIREILKDHPGVIFIALEKNLGNCRAFNRGLALANGNYIVDLSADDVLYPTRLEEGIQSLISAGPEYGVNYADAELISEEGKHVGWHSDKIPHDTVPQGDIYKDVIGRYFINSPTMMIRSEVFKVLGGYDESLAYEDFDFWVRSSRTFLYCYTPHALVKRRLVRTSMTQQQYKRNSPQMFSTFLVCQKIKEMNRNASESKALRKRILYEMRKAISVGELGLFSKYALLLLDSRKGH